MAEYKDLTAQLRLFETVCRHSEKPDIADLVRCAWKAIEELSSAGSIYGKAWTLGYDAGRDENMPRWIPVTERLPNCNGCYLVWRPHFFGGEIGMPSICYFDGSNTWHDSYGVDFARILHPEDVTHWMPLPEPPKDGDSDDQT